jgi:hypothetical protein
MSPRLLQHRQRHILLPFFAGHRFNQHHVLFDVWNTAQFAQSICQLAHLIAQARIADVPAQAAQLCAQHQQI